MLYKKDFGKNDAGKYKANVNIFRIQKNRP